MGGRKLAILIIAALVAGGCYRVDSGHAGVLWSFFGGTDMDDVYGEGGHSVPPWNRTRQSRSGCMRRTPVVY